MPSRKDELPYSSTILRSKEYLHYLPHSLIHTLLILCLLHQWQWVKPKCQRLKKKSWKCVRIWLLKNEAIQDKYRSKWIKCQIWKRSAQYGQQSINQKYKMNKDHLVNAMIKPDCDVTYQNQSTTKVRSDLRSLHIPFFLKLKSSFSLG